MQKELRVSHTRVGALLKRYKLEALPPVTAKTLLEFLGDNLTSELTLKELADITNRQYPTICAAVKRNNIPVSKRSPAQREIIELAKKMTVREIADELGVEYRTVWDKLKRLNVKAQPGKRGHHRQRVS
jgi:IS30 family transposase